MKDLNNVLTELGISKVRLAKYLGVSRQMLYNYLAIDDLNNWPKEKAAKLLSLLNIEEIGELNNIKITGEYIMDVENRLSEGVKDSSNKEVLADLKGFNKKEQELLSDIINLLKEKLSQDKTKETYTTYLYLFHFLQSMETTDEIKYILAYMTKSLGFTDPLEFAFNKDRQMIFESLIFSAMTLYNNGGASKSKLGEAHKRFVQSIEQKKEEKLSRTQELNTVKIQALKELGYTEINEDNAKDVFDKMAEIQSRKV
jgi:sulfur relay (sulfurtransferase) DsrC/TusE family protein